MKKTLLILGVCLANSVGGFLFAQSLTLSVVSTDVNINETFGASVMLEGIQGQGEVQIEGLEKFTVVGQSTSSSVQIINGNQSAQTIIQLQLEPIETGSFTLGPARLSVGGQSYESNVVDIDITGERLFGTSSTLPTTDGTSGSENDIEEAPSTSAVYPWYVYATFLFVLATFVGWFVLAIKTRRQEKKTGKILGEMSDEFGSSWSDNPTNVALPRLEDEDFFTKADQYFRVWSSQQLDMTYGELRTYAIDEICTKLRKSDLGEKEIAINSIETILLQALYAKFDEQRGQLLESLITLG